MIDRSDAPTPPHIRVKMWMFHVWSVDNGTRYIADASWTGYTLFAINVYPGYIHCRCVLDRAYVVCNQRTPWPWYIQDTSSHDISTVDVPWTGHTLFAINAYPGHDISKTHQLWRNLYMFHGQGIRCLQSTYTLAMIHPRYINCRRNCICFLDRVYVVCNQRIPWPWYIQDTSTVEEFVYVSWTGYTLFAINVYPGHDISMKPGQGMRCLQGIRWLPGHYISNLSNLSGYKCTMYKYTNQFVSRVLAIRVYIVRF